MAIIRKKEIKEMSQEELNKKLNEIKLEGLKVIKAGQGTSIKNKEIRKTIARILTKLNTKHGNMS